VSLLTEEPYPRVSVTGTARRSARKVWMVLWFWTAAWALVHTPGGGYSWHYFGTGARLLTGSGPSSGVHVYASHPELQMGPLAMLVAIPIRALSPAYGYAIAPALLTLTGPLLLALLIRAREHLGYRVTPTMLLSSGLLFLPVWTEVTTHYAHLDDVLAMSFGVGALLAAQRRSVWLTGILLAAAVDSKPWALSFAAVLLVLPAALRGRAVVGAALCIAVAWLPFLLGDPGTLSLTHFSIDNVDDSALHALGVHDVGTPAWDRPAQLAVGVAVGIAAVRHGRWPLILLAGVAARILLDPQTYPYYTSGLVLAALTADLLTPSRRLPLWTAACTGWYAANEILVGHVSPGFLGLIRLGTCAALLLAAALTTDRTEPEQRDRMPVGAHAVASPP
jgi:hypothetical protein